MSASASKHGQSVSVLTEAARHETAIMARVAAAEQESQRIVGQAHEQAAALLLETQQRTERDIAKMRQEAAQQRERDEASISAEAETKVARIREQATPNLDSIRQHIVSRILPAGVNQGE